MANESQRAGAEAGREPTGLHRVLSLLPVDGWERRAIDAGEIDAVIDYGSARIIMFPSARRALRDAARRANAADRKAALDTPLGNGPLAALPRAEYLRLLPDLEPVGLLPGDRLHEAGGAIHQVYFPLDCVVSLLTRIDGEETVETGLVGHEGMVGLPLALGVGVSAVHAVVRGGGTAMRMPAARFKDALQRGLQLQCGLYRYAQAMWNRAGQTAACNASHPFEQRLACWLLMVADRTRSQEMLMTQEHISAVLNVRRESVTLVCGSLRARGLISYRRGRLAILDRPALEAASCACYRAMVIDPAASAPPRC